MAGVLETLAGPRPSSFSAASLALIARSPISRTYGRPRSVKFSELRGLKIKSARSSGSSSSRLVHRGGLIVCEARETAVYVPAVTDAMWQSLVLESDSPVLVEFWAPWCGPCRMIHPIIDEVARQYIGKLKCYKVNTDESPSIATKYGIRSIPTVIIFKSGEKKESVVGAVPKLTLTTCIEKSL